MTDDNADSYSLDQWGIAVVVLLTRPDGARCPAGGQTPIDLDRTGPVSPPTLTELLESTVRLTPTEDIPVELIDLIDATPVPPAWRDSPWLRDHRPLTFTDNLCVVGEFTLGYQRHLGLYLDTERDHYPEA